MRNDDENLYEEAEKADGLSFTGPGWPADAGKMEALITDFAGKTDDGNFAWGTRLSLWPWW